MGVASKHPTFPILLETSRECLQDVFDLPGLREVLGQLRSRAVKVVAVDTPRASPFAQSLLFNWIAAYMYEGDAPLAERRAAALALDRDLLRDLLGAEELRELLDPAVLADIELELQCLTDGRRARSPDELHDVLRKVGDLAEQEADLRCEGDGRAWLAELERERRAVRVVVAGEARLIAAEDAARYRDALGCNLPLGLPQAFTEPVPFPLESLVARYARTHSPFVGDEVARRLGVPAERIAGALAGLETDDRVVRGEFRPHGTSREWCDVDVLRQLRRRSLAMLRREVEPVEPDAYARFVQAWNGIPGERRGLEALIEALGQLQGASLVASTLETEVLPARLASYRPVDLDELCTSGDVVWVGAGGLGANDGRMRLYFVDQVPMLSASVEPPTNRRARCTTPSGPSSNSAAPASGRNCAPPRRLPPTSELLAALWDLVWAGEVTNDSLAPLRAMLGSKRQAKPAAGHLRSRPRPGRLNRIGPPAGAGRWSLVEPLLPPPADHDGGGPRCRRCSSWSATAWSPVRRCWPRAWSAGSPRCTACSRCWRSAARCVAATSSTGLGAAQFAVPGAVDRLRAARDAPDVELHPELLAAPGRARRHGPGPAVRCRAAVAGHAGSSRPGGRRAGGAALRRAAGLVRPSLRPRRHLPGDGARPGLGRGAGHLGEGRPGPFGGGAQDRRRVGGAERGGRRGAARRRLHRVLPRLRRALVTDDEVTGPPGERRARAHSGGVNGA